MVGRHEVYLKESEGSSAYSGGCAPYGGFFAYEEAGGDEGEDYEVEDVRRKDGGEGVVEVGVWVVGVAEGAFS